MFSSVINNVFKSDELNTMNSRRSQILKVVFNSVELDDEFVQERIKG